MRGPRPRRTKGADDAQGSVRQDYPADVIGNARKVVPIAASEEPADLENQRATIAAPEYRWPLGER